MNLNGYLYFFVCEWYDVLNEGRNLYSIYVKKSCYLGLICAIMCIILQGSED